MVRPPAPACVGTAESMSGRLEDTANPKRKHNKNIPLLEGWAIHMATSITLSPKPRSYRQTQTLPSKHEILAKTSK